jgi:hypothetical protein
MNLPKRELDKRYKQGVDTGTMSSNNVELPLKSYSALNKPNGNILTDNIPKQELRMMSSKSMRKYVRNMKKNELRKAKLKNQ